MERLQCILCIFLGLKWQLRRYKVRLEISSKLSPRFLPQLKARYNFSSALYVTHTHTHTHACANAHAHTHTHCNYSQQAVWALGNIAGDSAQYRDITLSFGIMEPLLILLQDPSVKLPTMKNATWTLSNLCRGKNPPPDLTMVSKHPGLHLETCRGETKDQHN